MAARIAIVTDYSGQRTASILADLQEWHATLDARVISPLRRRHPSRAAARPGPASVLGALLGYRPHLVICETAGWTGLQAAMYRQASRRSRLLLAFAGTSGETGPADPLDAAGDVGWVSRSITRASDGWWGEDGAVAQAIERLRLPASPAAPVTAELDPFFRLRPQPIRSGSPAHRVRRRTVAAIRRGRPAGRRRGLGRTEPAPPRGPVVGRRGRSRRRCSMRSRCHRA